MILTHLRGRFLRFSFFVFCPLPLLAAPPPPTSSRCGSPAVLSHPILLTCGHLCSLINLLWRNCRGGSVHVWKQPTRDIPILSHYIYWVWDSRHTQTVFPERCVRSMTRNVNTLTALDPPHRQTLFIVPLLLFWKVMLSLGYASHIRQRFFKLSTHRDRIQRNTTHPHIYCCQGKVGLSLFPSVSLLPARFRRTPGCWVVHNTKHCLVICLSFKLPMYCMS